MASWFELCSANFARSIYVHFLCRNHFPLDIPFWPVYVVLVFWYCCFVVYVPPKIDSSTSYWNSTIFALFENNKTLHIILCNLSTHSLSVPSLNCFYRFWSFLIGRMILLFFYCNATGYSLSSTLWYICLVLCFAFSHTIFTILTYLVFIFLVEHVLLFRTFCNSL